MSEASFLWVVGDMNMLRLVFEYVISVNAFDIIFTVSANRCIYQDLVSTQNNIMESQHSAYSKERELQRPIFSVLTLSYIFCLEYFWPWYTNWMNLNSCGIRRLKIKCPWHCCRCCLNFCLHFGSSACSVALCSGVGLLFPCLPAHFYAVNSVLIFCSGDICRWFKYILKIRNAFKNSEDKSSFASLMIFKYQRNTPKALEVFQRNTNKSYANNIFRGTDTMLKRTFKG